MNKFKGFLARAGTKGKIAVSSAVALGVFAFPAVTAFADIVPGLDDVLPGLGGDITQPELPVEGGVSMWKTIGDGASSFIENVLTPVGTFCTSNEICLLFLSVTFVGLGVRMIRRVIGAFGRGR